MATNNAINEAVVINKGDIVIGTGTGGSAVLAIGTTGQVPTVTGGTLVYATPSGGTVTTGSSENGAAAVFDSANSTTTNLAFNGITSGFGTAVSGGGSNSPVILTAPCDVGTAGSSFYPAGVQIGSWGNTVATTTAQTTGNLYFVPFMVANSTVIKTLSVWVTAGSTSGSVVLGLYNTIAGNNKPSGSPITNSTGTAVTTSSAAAATVTLSTSVTLAPGFYWAAVSFSAACTVDTINTTSAGQLDLGYTTLAAGGGTVNYGFSQTFVYSSTLPAIGALSNRTTGSSMQLIWLGT